MTKLSRIGEWPSFCGMPVTSYERPDGMRYAFVDGTNDNKALSRNTGLVYRVFDEEALLLGMMVHGESRGRSVGCRLMEYFMTTVGQVEARFAGTGNIHKPVVALTAARVGLQPESEAFVAELLPRAQSDTSMTPKIHILQNQLPPSAVVDCSDYGKFYEVVHPDEVLKNYPINSPDKELSLHTSYA